MVCWGVQSGTISLDLPPHGGLLFSILILLTFAILPTMFTCPVLLVVVMPVVCLLLPLFDVVPALDLLPVVVLSDLPRGDLIIRPIISPLSVHSAIDDINLFSATFGI